MAEADDIIREDAAWAQQFRNSTSTLAQRAKYEDSIAAARNLDEQEGQAALDRRLETDAGARSLFLGRERLRQGQERLGQAERKMQQGQINFEAGQERLINKDIFETEMKTRKAELDELNAQRLMRKELFDTDNARRMLQQTTRVEENISDHIANGILPGSKEYAERALRSIAQNPLIDPKARASILGSAKILGDEEEFDTTWNKLTKEQQSRATVVDDPKGWRISVGPEKTQKPSGPSYEDLSDRYLKLLDKDPTDEADKGFVAMEKRRLLKAMKDIQGGTETAAGASKTTASTVQRPIFKDTAGNRAYKNPDGSFEPIP